MKKHHMKRKCEKTTEEGEMIGEGRGKERKKKDVSGLVRMQNPLVHPTR